MAKILILFSTTDGHTQTICNTLKRVTENNAHHTTVAAIEDFRQFDLPTFDKIVLGASIRYGKHNKLVFDFVRTHQSLLESKPNAFFTVNIVARKPHKSQAHTNPYMLKFLKQAAWQPKLVEVFAGKLNYPKYGALDRMMIRFIMLITKGPTDPTTVVEFTDWSKVEAFGKQISDI